MGVSGYLLVQVSPGHVAEVVLRAVELPQVVEVVPITGPYDVVVLTAELDEDGPDRVDRLVGSLPHVTRVLTCMACAPAPAPAA